MVFQKVGKCQKKVDVAEEIGCGNDLRVCENDGWEGCIKAAKAVSMIDFSYIKCLVLDGWMVRMKAVLRIAYSNQKVL